jgi:hypothetical protein
MRLQGLNTEQSIIELKLSNEGYVYLLGIIYFDSVRTLVFGGRAEHVDCTHLFCSSISIYSDSLISSTMIWRCSPPFSLPGMLGRERVYAVVEEKAITVPT